MQKDKIFYPQYRKWRENVHDFDGVIVGSDQTQEWLLPWWWDQYQKHNRFPVAFVDFGMSFEKKQWCRERGELVKLQVADIFVTEKEEIDPAISTNWEKQYGKKFWDCRNAWFKKPLACLQSPFRRTLWIDLDCEVKGSIHEIFDWIEPHGLAMSPDVSGPRDHPIYNSGVIAFRHGIAPIEAWGNQSFEKNSQFCGDQDLLSHILWETNHPIRELPCEYNWSRSLMDNPNALIYHWHGEFGHFIIRTKLSEFGQYEVAGPST